MQSGCVLYALKSTAHHNQTNGTPIRVGPKMSVTGVIVGLFASSAVLGACPLSMTWQIVSCAPLNSLVLVKRIYSV